MRGTLKSKVPCFLPSGRYFQLDEVQASLRSEGSGGTGLAMELLLLISALGPAWN